MSAKDLKEAAKGLPNNWEVFHSKKSKRLYYYNNETKKTQWHHPSLGERNKHGEKSKSKKRKASGDERNKVKHEKSKQSLKQQDETKQEQIPVKLKIDQTNCDASKLSEKLFLNALPKAKAPGKPFLKALPKLPSKSNTGNSMENTKRAAHDQKHYTETVKNNAQASKPCNETAQTNTRTFNSAKSNPQANEPVNQAVKADLEITNYVNPSGKTNSQAFKTLKEQKIPVLLKSKSQIEAKKIPKLQPLLRTKSLGEGSDSGVSESSDRILAWLADTSRINFKNHPVPNIAVDEDKVSSMKQAKQTSARITGKQKSERQKATIIERVETNSESAEPKSDILDKLLPKHSQTHAKQRYAPYKLNLTDLKHNKTKNSSQIEQEKGLPGQTTAKAKASSTMKISLANQNGLSSELTNNFARNLSGKTTADQNRFLVSETAASENLIESLFGVDDDNNVPLIASVQNVNLPSENCLQNGLDEPEQLVSSAVIQGHSEGNVQPDDDVFSMEEGVGSDVSIPLSESEVADMEIDNAEELAKEIVQELKQMRGSIVVQPSQIHKDNQMAMKVSSDGYEGILYIVLDTNVLLSHLKFVTELKDFPIPGVGMPTLVIPWVVIQELDSLKENKWRSHESGDKATRVDMLARVAIKFLNSSFQKSDPRMRGQTVEEASEHVGNLQQEMNDDRILQCCLLFHQRAQNGSCVLFSNDVNLCNKAMVNGIKAFNHEKLLPGLKDLFQCGAMVKQHSEEYNTQLVIEEDQARRRQKADDILCELQIILREGLSYIIENEMKKAYDDLWLEIVYIKPPWTLIDVLQLLDKHWMAVFGHVLKRDRKQLIDKLRQKYDDRKGTASSLQFCSEMLQLALQLFQSFACHSSYDDAMPKCLAAVNVLIQKCQQFQASVSTSSGTAQAKSLTYPTTSKITPVQNNNSTVEHGEVVSSTNGIPHEEVMNTFNLIWTAVTQFSTQIFTALGYPNTITDEAPQDFPKASKEEAISFLRVLCPKLLNLVRSIQNVLRDPWEKVSQNDNLFIQLEQAIAVFLKEVLSQENNATAEKLFNFCEDASMRTSLVQGLSQLDRASAMLQHCASCVVQSNTMSH